jgi:hypothetical protein
MDNVIDIDNLAERIARLERAAFGPPPPSAAEQAHKSVKLKAELAAARDRREALVAEHSMAGTPPSAQEHPCSRGGLHAATEYDELTNTIARLKLELAALERAS